jgi:hypothetical protein
MKWSIIPQIKKTTLVKMNMLKWQDDFFMFIQMGFFLIRFSNQRNHVFLVIFFVANDNISSIFIDRILLL